MQQLSFFEKLQILFSNILAHPVFICILLVPALILFLNKKVTKKFTIIIYIIVLAIVLFVGNSTLFELFDNLVDNIFMALYFPNFITLFLVEVLSAIITLITFIKKDILKRTKIINIVSFAIIQMIFCLVLSVIQVNDIDVYEENALYSNNDVLTLMQLLMGTFFLQVVTLVVIYVIDRITDRLDGVDRREIKHIVIEKEPEVVLPKQDKIKPLDKSLIIGGKMNPVDVKEEIVKSKPDLLKPMDIEVLEVPKKDTNIFNQKPINMAPVKEVVPSKAEGKENIFNQKPINMAPIKKSDLVIKQPEVILPKQEEIRPLDKSLINMEKVSPIDVKDIKETKPDLFKQEPLNKSLISTEKLKPVEVLDVPKKDIVEKPINMAPIKEVVPSNAEDKLDIFNQKPINIAPIKEDKLDELTDLNNESDELITNLKIVNFEKMLTAIMDLKTVYTM